MFLLGPGFEAGAVWEACANSYRPGASNQGGVISQPPRPIDLDSLLPIDLDSVLDTTQTGPVQLDPAQYVHFNKTDISLSPPTSNDTSNELLGSTIRERTSQSRAHVRSVRGHDFNPDIQNRRVRGPSRACSFEPNICHGVPLTKDGAKGLISSTDQACHLNGISFRNEGSSVTPRSISNHSYSMDSEDLYQTNSDHDQDDIKECPELVND